VAVMRPLLDLFVGPSALVASIEPGTAVPHVSARCDGSGRCVEVCPEHVLTRALRRVLVINTDTCNGCNRCVDVCPGGAITLVNGVTGHPIG
jgi:NAD-dependent dihydropyrimidine dehydrogenase PreA subunit